MHYTQSKEEIYQEHLTSGKVVKVLVSRIFIMKKVL